jgi:putative FmdB family regulatory protein
MPIYEYECTQCGMIQEAWQKISDKPLTICEQCSGPLKKIMSQNSFHLKGTGWYVSDYGGKQYGREKESEKIQSTNDSDGVLTKTPIIKDRNTGKTLSGPDI